MKNKYYSQDFFRNARKEEKRKPIQNQQTYTNDARNNYNVKRGKSK